LELRQTQVIYQHLLSKKKINATVTMMFSKSQKWVTHPEWNQNELLNLQQIITVQTKTGSMAGTHEYK
jgi:hypothetical protein